MKFVTYRGEALLRILLKLATQRAPARSALCESNGFTYHSVGIYWIEICTVWPELDTDVRTVSQLTWVDYIVRVSTQYSFDLDT